MIIEALVCSIQFNLSRLITWIVSETEREILVIIILEVFVVERADRVRPFNQFPTGLLSVPPDSPVLEFNSGIFRPSEPFLAIDGRPGAYGCPSRWFSSMISTITWSMFPIIGLTAFGDSFMIGNIDRVFWTIII